MEIIQYEEHSGQKRTKKKKKNEESLRDLWDKLKYVW